MELQLRATDQITYLDGVPCRVWNGITERGVACWVFVRSLAVHDGHDSNQFEQELHECLPPGRLVNIRQVH